MKYIHKFNLILIKFLLYLLCCYYLLLYIITDVKCFDWRKIFFISILTLFLKLQQITTNPTLTSYLDLTLKWPWIDLTFYFDLEKCTCHGNDKGNWSCRQIRSNPTSSSQTEMPIQTNRSGGLGYTSAPVPNQKISNSKCQGNDHISTLQVLWLLKYYF